MRRSASVDRRFVMALVLAAWRALSGVPAIAAPDWTKPYLDLPTPSGGYIARNDDWVVVQGEVEFALTDKSTIEARYRFLLENRSDRPEAYTTTVPWDEGAYELKDPMLYVQRTLWHRLNLAKRAERISVKGLTQSIIASAEKIDPHRKVFLEYAIADKHGFTPWMVLRVPRDEPIAKLHVSVEAASAARGLVLELRRPEGEPIPASFRLEPDGSWTVSQVPAWSRIGTRLLLYQPATEHLYPSFLARASKDPSATFAGLASKYRKIWNERLAGIDSPGLKGRVESLTAGAATGAEKVARLAGFVQHEVQNDDSNESASDAWVPLSTAETLRSMKGDCKGKVMLLQALLQSAGVASAPVLIHLDPASSDWGESPGTADLNHVVLAIDLPGELGLDATLLEGPCRGRVLFDPTRTTAVFGGPLPGYEDQPALFVGDAADPKFTIHTATPSLEAFSARIELRVAINGSSTIKIGASDNGGSDLVRDLTSGGTPERHKELLQRALADRLPRARVVRESAERPAIHPPAPGRIEVEVDEPQSLQVLGDRSLLVNPFGLGALFAGLPSDLRPPPPVSAPDEISLAPPWDCKRNVQGSARLIDIQVHLTLPASLRWTPPQPLVEDRPWLKLSERWVAGADNAFEGQLHLELPRGSWPPEGRRERLKVMDDLYTRLTSPLILGHAGPP